MFRALIALLLLVSLPALAAEETVKKPAKPVAPTVAKPVVAKPAPVKNVTTKPTETSKPSATAKPATTKKPVPSAKAPVQQAKPNAKVVRPSLGLPAVALSASDRANAKAAFDALEAGKYDEARTAALRCQSDIPLQIVTWVWLQRPGNGAAFEDIARFIDTHAEWPARETLQRRAEEVLDANVSDDRVIAWFANREPVSGDGRMRLAEALLRFGRTEEAKQQIRSAWMRDNFAGRDENDILRKYDTYLGPTEHNARLNRLLWDRQIEPARRMMPRVDQGQRALAEARIALITRTGNIDKAIASVPANLLADAGLAYERLRWRREKGLTDAVEAILLAPVADLGRAEKWWTERQIRARTALNEGRISDAYQLASNHGPLDNRSMVEAEWLAGWIALRFLNEAQVGAQHFLASYEVARFPVSRARGAYWIGRAAEARNDAERANQWYAEAAHHPATFYGQLALAKLGRTGTLPLPPDPQPSREKFQAFEKRSVVQATQVLAELDQQDRLRAFILRLQEQAEQPDEHAMVIALARQIGRVDLGVVAAKRAAQRGVLLVDGAFPIIDVLAAQPLPEPAAVLALSRQESEFNQHAVSPAGARGLMQLMPATAKEVSRGLQLGYQADWLTSDAAYNARLGSAYLNTLLGNWDGSFALALAGYNAGEGRVRKWIKDWGDPRMYSVDVVDWIELIPFSETRNYVQRVTESLQVYRYRLKPSEAVVQIELDLRGRRKEAAIQTEPTR